MSLRDWLDERVGYRTLLQRLLDEPVAGGARFAYVFGSVLLLLLIVQALSGLLLAAVYSPSLSAAWASVAYIEAQLPVGWFVRGLHAAGASALMGVAALHLLQVTIYGAYRRPREVNWWVGLLLLTLFFAFALTGYLLPWDQKGYFATQVATSLLSALPLGGPFLRRLLIGGDAYGNLTLTHFFALHTLLLPAVAVLFVFVHVALMRRHGVTPSWRKSPSALTAASEPFWPGQALRDLAAGGVAVVLLAAWVIARHGAGLEAPADPTAPYEARPEWYFVPLFQLLKYFSGPLETGVAVGVPIVILGVLFIFPFWDRASSRAPGQRKRFIALVLLLLGGHAALCLLSARDDRRNPTFAAARRAATAQSQRALALSRLGVPAEGGTAVFENDPLQRGRALVQERCLGCHSFAGAGAGEARAPLLDGWSSRSWLRDFLRDPDGPQFFGPTKVHGMKPVKAQGRDLDALVEWVYSLGGGSDVDAALAERGKQLFLDSGCDNCHELDGSSAGEGPNLGGRGSAAWTRALIEDASAAPFFGHRNSMPKFKGKLSSEELDALVELLRHERSGR